MRPTEPPDWRPDVQAIRDRLQLATRGPWVSRTLVSGSRSHLVLACDGDVVAVCFSNPGLGEGSTAADVADLIAHAPEDLAALVERVDELRLQLEAMTEIAAKSAREVTDLRAQIADRSKDVDAVVSALLTPSEFKRLRLKGQVIVTGETIPADSDASGEPDTAFTLGCDRRDCDHDHGEGPRDE